jgi:hypothetical protein
MQCIAESDTEASGVTRAVHTLVPELPNVSLNALLLTPSALFAIHVDSKATSPPRALNALYPSDADMPHRHATEYYTIDYRITTDAAHGRDRASRLALPEIPRLDTHPRHEAVQPHLQAKLPSSPQHDGDHSGGERRHPA